MELSCAPSKIQPTLREDQKRTEQVKEKVKGEEGLAHEPFNWYFSKSY